MSTPASPASPAVFTISDITPDGPTAYPFFILTFRRTPDHFFVY